jgi:hypothetical protein
MFMFLYKKVVLHHFFIQKHIGIYCLINDWVETTWKPTKWEEGCGLWI